MVGRQRNDWLFWAAFTACIVLMSLHVWHFVFLCDDAYIFFRYARNLVRGHGLVFNPSEYVEGYTSLIWVLQLAVGEALGISGEFFAHVLSVGYTIAALFVLARLILNQPLPGRRGVLLLVLLALACNRNWAVWATGGLETRSFSFFVLLVLYLANASDLAGNAKRRTRALVHTSLAAGLAVLARPDALLLFPLILLFCLLRPGTRRYDSIALLVPFALLAGGQFAWRLWYYGDWLPNTYYAKVGPPWPEMGWRFAAMFLLEYAYYLVLPAILSLWWFLGSPQTQRLGILGLVWITLHAGYYCHEVGGDHFEFRIFDSYVPLLSWMFCECLLIVARRQRAVAILGGGMVLAYSLILPLSDLAKSSTFRNSETWIGPPSWEDFSQTLKTAGLKPDWQRIPAIHFLPLAAWIAKTHGELYDELRSHLVGCRHEYLKTVWLEFRGRYILGRGVTDRWTLPVMTIAASGIGALGYFIDLPLIDTLGLTDRVTAHQGVSLHPLHAWRVMAHDRLAPASYLERRHAHAQIDSITVQPLGGAPASAWVPVPEGRRLEFFSLQLPNGLWLNFHSWDPEWVRSTFLSRPRDHRLRVR